MLSLVAALGAGLWATRALSSGSGAPSELSAKAISPSAVVLGWKGSDGADSYVVKVGSDRALTGTGTKAIKASTKDKTTLRIDDLKSATPGADLFYRVDAVRDGKTTSSRTSRFSLLPGKVGAVKVDKVAADGVKITWPAVANSRQYDVEVARDKSFKDVEQRVRTLGGASRFVTANLDASTRYWIRVRPLNAAHAGVFSTAATFTTRATEFGFRVATWNVCSEKCGGYASRARVMSSFLDANKVDIFGLQESGGKRVGRTTNAVFSGHSQKFQRASGGAEARYIFYRPELFRQLSGSYFAVGHGRHATWAKFQIKKTGRIFYFVDVHLENGKGNDGKRSSEMDVLLSRMAQINDKGLPMLYAGDFNSGRHRGSDSPGVKLRAAGFADSFVLAKKPINGQFNTSFPDGGRPASGAHVDHIWVSKAFKSLGVEAAPGRHQSIHLRPQRPRGQCVDHVRPGRDWRTDASHHCEWSAPVATVTTCRQPTTLR